jgi:hypothetical protein
MVRRVWVFDCARCAGRFYLRAALALADGTLVCPGCVSDDDEAHDTQRCKTCGRMLPASEFEREVRERPRDLSPELAEVLDAVRAASAESGRNEVIECKSCRAKVAGPSVLECRHCGAQFESKRSHARYCSNACRQAAHREGRQRAGPA